MCVYLATSAPTIGYMDPATFEILEDIPALEQYVFQTENEFTPTISGTAWNRHECTLGTQECVHRVRAARVTRYGGSVFDSLPPDAASHLPPSP